MDVVVLAAVDVVLALVDVVVLAIVEVVLALVLVGGSSPGQVQGGLEQVQGFSSPVHLVGFLPLQ